MRLITTSATTSASNAAMSAKAVPSVNTIVASHPQHDVSLCGRNSRAIARNLPGAPCFPPSLSRLDMGFHARFGVDDTLFHRRD
jgi:hypothetical protein